jgi:hypothetical protein
LGDNSTVKIIRYDIIVSPCGSPLNCTAFSDQVLPDSILGQFQAPVKYSITFNLSEGYVYYFQVSSVNELNRSSHAATIVQQFGIILGSPSFDYPSSTGASVALVDGKLQVWQNGNVSDTLGLRILNIPVVRSWEVISVMFSFGNWSSFVYGDVISSSIRSGTAVQINIPTLPQTIVSSCQTVAVSVLMSFAIAWNQIGTMQYRLNYFCYPNPVLVSLVPSRGSVSGGTLILIGVSDPGGPFTRQGANLANFQDVLLKRRKLQIIFNGLVETFTVEASILSISASQDGSQSLIISSRTPTVSAADVANTIFVIDGVAIPMDTSFVSSRFEFVGSKILSVTPASGMLNPGSGGLNLIIKVSNLLASETSINISVGGGNCPIVSPIPRPTASSVGTETTLSCLAPELPLDRNGSILIQVMIPRATENILTWNWLYSLPVSSLIDAASVAIDDRIGPPLWLADSRTARVSFTIRNVGATLGRIVRNMSLDGAEIGGTTFLPTGQDLKIDLRVVSTGPVRPSALLTIWIDLEIDVDVFSATTFQGFSVEIRDTSQPRMVALAPSEIPAMQSSVFLLGILSAPQYLSAPVGSLECILSFQSVNISLSVGIVPLDRWIRGDGRVQSYFPNPLVTTLMSGISDDIVSQFQNLVVTTSTLVSQGGTTNNAIVVGIIPQLALTNTSDATITGLLTLSHGSSRLSGFISVSNDIIGTPSVFAKTENNDLRSGLGGNIRLTMTLQKFPCVRRASDISINFDAASVTVQRLMQSNSNSTVLAVIVPPSSTSKIVLVTAHAIRQPSIVASFSLQYYDDRIPVISSVVPFQVYSAPGGTSVQVQLTSFPQVPLSSIVVQIQVGVVIFPDISAVSCSYSASDIATLVFLTPSSTVSGTAVFKILISSSGVVTVPARFQMVPIPSTRGTVVKVTPSSGLSSGGVLITVILSNTKMVLSSETVLANVSLGFQWQLLNCSVLASSISQTTLNLIAPAFPYGGDAVVELWQVGRREFSSTFEFFFVDINVPVVNYIYPSSGITGQGIAVEISVARFGISSDVTLYSFAPSAAQNGSILNVRRKSDGSTVLSSSLFCWVPTYSLQNITVQYCSSRENCLYATFLFEFRDPNAPVISFFSPSSVSTDGRVPISVEMTNLPVGASTALMQVQIFDDLGSFTRNASVSNLQVVAKRGDFLNIQFQFIAPEAFGRNPAQGLLVQLNWFDTLLSQSGQVTFPSTFAYTNPPDISITSAVPMKSFVEVSSTVVLTISNFPGVTQVSDIIVEFSNSNSLASVAASVVSFSRINPSLYKYAAQGIRVVLSTPVGGSISEGNWRLSAYHTSYYERVAFLDGFSFSSSAAPQTQGMTSETGQTGTASLAVRRSTRTMVTVVVGSASTAPTTVIIGSAQVDLIRSDWFASSNTATVVFNAPSSQCVFPCTPVYGFISFSGSCSKCADASCCQSATCSLTCGSTCRSACFSLLYYDDLAPILSYQSDFQGPSTGGTAIRMRIANFPVIRTGSDAAAAFLKTNIPATIYVISSSTSVTDLTIVTPPVDTNGENSLKYSQNSLFAATRPDLVVTFPFEFNLVSPTIQALSPSSGVRSGNVFVTVIIANFPYPSFVGISFGSTLLPDSAVSILPISNSLSTVISFTTPSSATSGVVNCRIYPKACPLSCGQAVTFTFEQIEAVQILPPTPSRNAIMESAPSITVRLRDFPSQGTVFIVFLNTRGPVLSPPVQSTTSSGTTTAVTFSAPNEVGVYTCNIIVQSNGMNTTLPFPYEVFDGNQIRVMSVQPLQAPIRTQIYGQTINLRSSISLMIANFPQGLMSSMLVVSFGNGLFGDILMIQDSSTCSSQGSNCNRTRIVVLAPSIDVPGTISCRILSTALKSAISFALTFFAACDFVSFCANNFMVADSHQVLQSPPSDSNCDRQYCVDPTKLLDPVLISNFPSEGPATGGTIVVVRVRNLPILSIQSVLIRAGVGAQQVLTRPLSLVQDDGSNLKSSSSTVTFRTISSPTGGTASLSMVPYVITSSLGPISKQLSFSFQYTPVIVGNAVVVGVYPSSVQSAIPTQVSWQLQNFPRVTASTAFRIIAKLACQTELVRATSVISSTYTQTIAIMIFNINFIGICPVQIFWEDNGVGEAGIFNMTVDPPPSPSVLSWFPRRGIRGSSMTANVINLDPSTQFASFRVSLADGEQVMNISNVAFTGSSACTLLSCSKFAITFAVPNLVDDGISRSFVFTIVASNKVVSFSVPFDSQLLPVVTSILPVNLVLTESNLTDITLVIGNAASFCGHSDSLAARFDKRPGILKGRVLKGSTCTVTLRAPLIPDDSEISCTLSNSITSLEFCRYDAPIRLQLLPAPLIIEPIDSTCSGGNSIKFVLLGYSGGTYNSRNVSVVFGGLVSNGVAVNEWRPGGDSIARMSFTATTPVFNAPSASIQGFVVMNGAKISFPILFECFAAPQATVSPRQAILDGTTSAGSKLTSLALTNFPSLSKSGDVLVAFDDVVCDGVACAVLSFQNLANGPILSIQVPAWATQATIQLSVTFRGAAAPPAGGDPKTAYVRMLRTASVPFVFAIPAPVVLSARFCSRCNSGSFCIVNARCSRGQSPRSNSIAMSGIGVLTLVVDNVPQISYDAFSGAVLEPAAVSLQLGSIYASVRRIVFVDASRLSFEAQLVGPAPASGIVLAQVSVQPNTAAPIVTVVNFQINIFNDKYELKCLSAKCQGSSLMGNSFLVSLNNFPLMPTDVSELISIRFGDLQAVDVQLINSTDELSVFSVSPPNYNCTACQFSAGRADVMLSILYASNLQEIAETVYTFWAPPAILEAAFQPSGTWIRVTFDQASDRAGMQARDDKCDRLFQNSAILLGGTARCVWAADDELNVYLGQQATVVPGSILAIAAAGGLRSSNGLSVASSSNIAVTAPSRVKPSVIINSVDVIDPCSALEIRATIASPRPLTSYTWMCLNDAALNSYLSSVTGGILSLRAGTPEMQTADKTYSIAFSATDFLGSSTDKVVMNVFKQAVPAPQVQFSPTSLFITRDQPVFVRGQAAFSSCPVDQNELTFSWRLVLGLSDFPSSSLNSKIPQIYVPPGKLTAGSIYVLGLQVRNARDASQSSEGQFVLQVGYQLLVAIIDGGSHLVVSSDTMFTLSAANSYDPDAGSNSKDQNGNISLGFSWQCTVSDGLLTRPCRDLQGATLNLGNAAQVKILGNTLAPVDAPYVFTVTITKLGRAPATASMPVYIVADSRATVTIASQCIRADFDQRGCCVLANGAIFANTNSKLNFLAISDRPNTTYAWTLLPSVSVLDVSAAPLGYSTSIFLIQGAIGVFVAGNTYTVRVLGYGYGAAMPGEAQQTLTINSPPAGGSFAACLVPAGGSVIGQCLTTGTSVIDLFRLSCSGWTDPEGGSLLEYRFGYFVAAENVSASPAVTNVASNFVWFDWAGDSVKEMSFPSGNVTVTAQVKDECGAYTDILTTTLMIGAANAGLGRRLLASSDFWAKARAKVQGALQTFRPDNVNQLSSAMAAEISMLRAGSSNAVALRESLILSLRSAADQVSSDLLFPFAYSFFFVYLVHIYIEHC